MSMQSRLWPIGRVERARKRTAGTDSRGTGNQAGSRGSQWFEQLEGRRLLSVAAISGAPSVNEASPYTINLSASGIGAAAGTSDWTLNWGADGPQVIAGGATSANHTFDDGPANQTITAYRTNQVVSGLLAGDGDIAINDVAIDSLGRIVTVGQVLGVSWLEVRRFNPDGTPDATFGANGVFNGPLAGTFGARLTDVAIDSANRIVAAGDVTVAFGHREGLLARFNDSGLDISFNSLGAGGAQAGTVRANFGKLATEDAEASAVVVQPDGNVLVGGTITTGSGTRLDFGLSRYDASGTIDASFSGGSVRTDFAGGADELHDLAITTSGATLTGIYAVGTRSTNDFAVAAYLPGGSPNTGFGGGKVVTPVTAGNDIASNVAIDSSGRVVVSGFAGGAIGLVRYNPTGTLDATFGSGGIQTTTSATGSYTPDQDLGNVLIDAGGKILVGARLSNNSGGGGFAVVRYTAAGSPDATFGINGLIFRSAPDRFGGAIRLQSDGGIVQAGTVPDSTNTHERNAIVFHYANAAAGLVVQNVAPSASVTSAATGAPHQPFFMDFALDDVSSADRAAGIAVSIDWGDGSPVDTANPFPTGVTPGARVYNEAGTYTITFTATDKDGGTTVATTTFTITTTAVVADDVNGGQMLIVSGGRSSGAGGSNSNVIDLRPAAGGVRVNVDGAITDIAASIGRVVVYGNGGDDTITVSGSISLPVEFYGGDGDDSLRAGGRDDILSGGPGADLLVGGNGRDIVIGGLGVDRIVGNSDDDILIGGTLAGEEFWPDFGVDRFSLSLIRSEWTSSHTYAQRVANLRDGSGTPGQALNDGAYLVADVTVLDDDAADVLTGDSGSDWFFANVDGSPPDVITDLTSKEFVDDLDFINAV